MSFRDTEKIIRRINRVLESYALKFGKDYSLYSNILNALNMNEIATRLSNKGIVQIQRGKINQNLNKWQLRELVDLAKHKSAAEIYKATKKSMQDNPQPPVQNEKYPIINPITGKVAEDPVLIEILKKDYVKQNNDIFYYLSVQINAGNLDKLSPSEKALYNRAAGRSEEMTYDELYMLIHAAKGD